MLSFVGLRAQFGRRVIFDNLSHVFTPQKVTALIGSNGCGKSTLLKMLIGLVKPAHGNIILDGAQITNERVTQRVKRGIAYAAQFSTAIPELSVIQNLLLNPICTRALAVEYLRTYELDTVKYLQAKFLSGGELKRLEIAMAVSCEPSILIVDEPFFGVDPRSCHILSESFARMKSEKTIILSENRLTEIRQFADEFLLLLPGHFLIFDSWASLLISEKAQELYLGAYRFNV